MTLRSLMVTLALVLAKSNNKSVYQDENHPRIVQPG